MDIETSIRAESGVYVHVSEWEDGAWIKMSVDRASIYTPLTRAEAEKLLAGLQALLAKELQHG
jgi:hypothetical protein